MTPPHTPESLLSLTKSPEGLEQMRIIAAEFDKHTKLASPVEISYMWRPGAFTVGLAEWAEFNNKPILKDWLPNYPTSLDAIFAAEERLGLHDNEGVQEEWITHVGAVCDATGRTVPQSFFLPPPLRLIPFILTAQWKEQNQ